MWRQLLPGLRMTLVLTVLTGLIYPGVVTGLCQLLFPNQANGSLETKDGKIIGSTLLRILSPTEEPNLFPASPRGSTIYAG